MKTNKTVMTIGGVKFHVYRDIDIIYAKFLNIPVRSLTDNFVGAYGKKAEDRFVYGEEKAIKLKLGCWAFVYGEDVHIWFNSNVTRKELLGLIAHELGHNEEPQYSDYDKEEDKANRYQDVSKLAYDAMKRIIKVKKNENKTTKTKLRKISIKKKSKSA